MHSHFAALIVFSLLVAVVFAIITKSTPRDQIQYGVFVFIAFLTAALVIGWIMYPFPF